MPDVQEVFRMATQEVRPDPGALERQNRTQRGRVIRQRAGGYAVLAALVVTGLVIGISAVGERDQRPASRPGEGDGPATGVEGLAPTVDRLRGIWYEDSGTGLWGQPIMARFGPDGTFSLGGVLDEDAWISGTYQVEGHRIIFIPTGGECGGRDVFTWEAGIVAEGRLESVHGGAEGDRPTHVGTCLIPVGEPYNLTRVSPTSPAAADINPTFYSTSLTGETTAADLRGFWLVEGTGHLLRVDRSGSYLLDDAGELGTNPDDAGSVEIGRESLRFITGGGSSGCSEGDVMVWKDARVEEGRLRGVVAEDSCGHDLGGEVTLLFLSVDTP
jgi:hypothetical protein